MLLINTVVVLTLFISVYFDLRTRRIPNLLTLSAMLLGLGLQTIESGWPGTLNSLGGLLIGFGVLLAFYVTGGMGAGDVKLMGGIGALIGVKLTVMALIYMILAGGVIAAYVITKKHAWKDTLSRLIFFITFRSDITEIIKQNTDKSPLKITIPYGVAIGIGTLLALLNDTIM